MRTMLLAILTFSSILAKIEAFVLCPYCDPNHMAYPNLEEAMRGYDVPMGNPNPGHGMGDPGIRNQIFSPMIKNEDGHYQLDTTFVTANHQIKCDATWSSNVYDNLKQYVDGKTRASTTGFGIEFGPSLKAQVGKGAAETGSARLGASMSIPPLFSRSWSSTNDVEDLQDFFVEEHGAIVTTEAICLTNKVDVGLYSQKKFVQPFLDAVHALHLASESENEQRRIMEFKRFVNEFGTHYASTSEMGTKISIERRYSEAERRKANKNDLKNCNTLAGAKVFGLQMEQSHFHCNKTELLGNDIDSERVERMVVTTHGSFVANSLADWSKQVISLVQAETFSPRVIRRELKPILQLFEEKNFNHEKLLNITQIKEWMEPLMANYCVVFELECDKTGCGIDDNCTADQWCIDVDIGFECINKTMSLTLENGRLYLGQVDLKMIPDGHGTEYYPSGEILYEGEFKHGLRDGQGTFYYESGLIGYVGEFRSNFMDGHGKLYFQESGNLLFNGILREGEFLKGTFYYENGTVSETLEKK